MKKLQPVKTIMSTDLITVGPKDTLSKIKEIFDTKNIHHIPVVEFKSIVGMISKTDMLFFQRGQIDEDDKYGQAMEKVRSTRITAEEIMTKNLAKLEADDPLRTAIAVFSKNKFHALPVVENGDLVGIVTTFDLIKLLDDEKVGLEEYSSKK